MIITRSIGSVGTTVGNAVGRARPPLRATLLPALVATLLAAAAVGTVAQSDAAVPVSFTGRIQFLGQDCGEGSTRQVVGGVEQVRDYRCARWMGTTDPRFTGSYTTVGNIDTYAEEESALPNGPFVVSTFVHRVENDQGAWEGVTTTAYVDSPPGSDDVPHPTETLVLRGEGAYDGLTAVLWQQPEGVHGVIFGGAPPPAPSTSVTQQPE